MNHTVYTVHAYRWGDFESHSYIVGVYSEPEVALMAAATEEEWRGGKYECEVLEWEIAKGRRDGEKINKPRVLKRLPLDEEVK